MPEETVGRRKPAFAFAEAEMTTRLYHNPRCSKSRGALELLRERGIEPQIVAYLDQPPSIAELRELLRLLGTGARSLLRDGEPEYTELGLADPSLDEDALIAAMAAHPRLIERPVFMHAGRAVIGRPPERVLELL
jgi:arsenate reductase (glutaredoxin)